MSGLIADPIHGDVALTDKELRVAKEFHSQKNYTSNFDWLLYYTTSVIAKLIRQCLWVQPSLGRSTR